jgi:DNA-binding MarR family transcriptional regulator
MPQRSPADRRHVLVDLTPAGQAVLDRVLPEVQQLVTAVMGTLDDQALHTLLDHLTAVRQAPRRTPPQLRRS